MSALALVLTAELTLAQISDPTAPPADPPPVTENNRKQETATSFAIDLSEALARKSGTEPQASAAILTRELTRDLRKRGFLTLGQFLGATPGFIHAPRGLEQSPGARGLTGSVNFMIDGISLTSPVDYRYPAGLGLFLEEFERIEAISGPAGVPWGAHALLGTINMLSGGMATESTEVSMTLGSRDLQRVTVADGHRLGPGVLRLFAGYANVRNPVMRPRLQYTGVPPYTLDWSVTANTAVTQPALDRFGVVSARYATPLVSLYLRLPFAREHQQISDLGSLLPPRGDGRRDVVDGLAAATFQTTALNGQIAILARGVWYLLREEVYRPLLSTAAPDDDEAASLRRIMMSRFATIVEASHRLQWRMIRSDLMLGVEGMLETPHGTRFIASDPYFDSAPTDYGPVLRAAGDATGSAYLFEELKLWERLSLSGGARVNAAGTYKPTWLTQANAALRVFGQSYAKFSFTQGMRPPTLLDRYGVQPVKGNPNLSPERSWAYQFEANTRFALPGIIEKGFVRADFTRTDTDSNIYREGLRFKPFVQNAIPLYGTTGSSWEALLELAWRGNVDTTVSFWSNQVFDKQRAVEGATTEQRRLRSPNRGPAQRWYGQALYAPVDSVALRASGTVQCRGKYRYLAAPLLGDSTPQVVETRMPCYTTLGAGLRWTIPESDAHIDFTADNLTDERPPVALYTLPELFDSEPRGGIVTGRTFFFTLTWSPRTVSAL